MVFGKKHRLLVIAHGHPDFSRGGGEIAAHVMFEAYRRHEGVEQAVFLARVAGDGSGGITKHSQNEYLWARDLRDGFFMEGSHPLPALRNLAGFLRSMRPDIVHLHHAAHMGYEMLELIRRELPDAKICFTLHEYIPICHNDGQMVKTDGSLCFKSGLEACQKCFPDMHAEDFWQRKRRFMHYFSLVDIFFAPSSFLRSRYIDWGLAPEKIHVLENGLGAMEECPERKIENRGKRNRFGYFGQITKYKGLSLLLQGIKLLSEPDRKKIILEIHGAGFGEVAQKQELELRAEYQDLTDAGIVRWIGAYDPTQIASRMNGIDWVVVPSIWWENSPVVIQEAFACGRPVLASSMGGMAEKVRHGIDGLLVAPRNPQAWADAMLECARDNVLWERLGEGIKKPAEINEKAAHIINFVCG